MAMQKSNMKTDDASRKMDATCNDMMTKHDSMMKNDNRAMPKNGMAASAPMGQSGSTRTPEGESPSS
jgi:hypothetical protein